MIESLEPQATIRSRIKYASHSLPRSVLTALQQGAVQVATVPQIAAGDSQLSREHNALVTWAPDGQPVAARVLTGAGAA
jgi:hypothetical protein